MTDIAPVESGRVYFIQGAPGGPIKIGYSREPSKRLAALQTGHSEQLRVLADVPGSRELERQLHARFAKLRAHGEWFEPGQELLDFVGCAAAILQADSKSAETERDRDRDRATRLAHRYEQVGAAIRAAGFEPHEFNHEGYRMIVILPIDNKELAPKLDQVYGALYDFGAKLMQVGGVLTSAALKWCAHKGVRLGE